MAILFRGGFWIKLLKRCGPLILLQPNIERDKRPAFFHLINMGRQVLFYFTPEDVAELEPALQDLGATFIESRMKKAHLKTAPTMQMNVGKSLLRVYLAQRKDINKIILREVPAQNYWTVDSRKSPIIELDRCFFDGKVLRRGRLFYDAGFYDDLGLWTDKSKDFVEWAAEMFKLFRKNGIRSAKLGAYLGLHAKDWLSRTPGAIMD